MSPVQNFLFSLNATVPVFLVMIGGWICKRIHLLNDNFVDVANKFAFNIAFPALLFCDIYSMDVRDLSDVRFVGFCAGVTTLSFALVWIGARIFLKDKAAIGSFVQGACRGSSAILGVAFVQNIYGDAGFAPLMIVGAVPIYNILSVLVLSLEKGENAGKVDGARIKKTMLDICRNPMIIAILLGVVCNLAGLRIPVILDKMLDSFASLATPLALVAIGAGFELGSAVKKVKPTVAASLIKLVVQPLVFLPVAIHMGFTGARLVAILIMLGSPTTVSSFIMAKSMGGDSVLASGIVVLTTLLSAVTMTVSIFVLKNIGAI